MGRFLYVSIKEGVGLLTEMKNYVWFMTFYDISVKVAVRITTINTGGCRVKHVLPRIERGLGIGLYIWSLTCSIKFTSCSGRGYILLICNFNWADRMQRIILQ